MANAILEKKQDKYVKVRFDKSLKIVIFRWNGKEIFRKTIEECEEIYPQYLWCKTKESPYKIFYL